MRSRLLSSCVMVLLLVGCVCAQGAALPGRQDATIGLDPSFERVGGDSTTATLRVVYDGIGVVEGLRGYHIAIDFDDARVFVEDVNLDVEEGDLLAACGPTAFYATLRDANTLVVDGSILGTTAGATGAGVLFQVTFSGRPTGTV